MCIYTQTFVHTCACTVTVFYSQLLQQELSMFATTEPQPSMAKQACAPSYPN